MSAAAPGTARRSPIGSLAANSLVREAIVIAVVTSVLLFVIPEILSDFRLNQMGRYLTFAIVAIGIDLIWGYTGMLSLGQAVFFGLGGYAMAMYLKMEASGDRLPDFMGWSGVKELPWFWEPFASPWFAIPMVMIGPAVLAFLFGYLVFRSRIQGVYFAIVTQALAMIASVFMVSQQQFTGGTNGITNFTNILGFRVGAASTQYGLYIATVIVLLLAYIVARYITRSRYGRLLVAVRDDEERVRFTGYNVALVKATVFAIAAAFAGVAGALFVPQAGIISPANLGVVPSIEMVLWVAVGGRGTIAGAVIGALVVSWARSFLSESYPDTWLFALGAMFIGSVVLFPRGIAGIVIDGVTYLQVQFDRLRGRRDSPPEPDHVRAGAIPTSTASATETRTDPVEPAQPTTASGGTVS